MNRLTPNVFKKFQNMLTSSKNVSHVSINTTSKQIVTPI